MHHNIQFIKIQTVLENYCMKRNRFEQGEINYWLCFDVAEIVVIEIFIVIYFVFATLLGGETLKYTPFHSI